MFVAHITFCSTSKFMTILLKFNSTLFHDARDEKYQNIKNLKFFCHLWTAKYQNSLVCREITFLNLTLIQFMLNTIFKYNSTTTHHIHLVSHPTIYFSNGQYDIEKSNFSTRRRFNCVRFKQVFRNDIFSI